jgi:hypothetical protein
MHILRRIFRRENAAQAKPLSPTLDFVFKTLFSGKDEDSREALRLLLTSCTHRPVRDLRLQNTEILPAFLLFPQSAKVPRRYVFTLTFL